MANRRMISKDVVFPLTKDEKEIIKNAMENLRFSQIDEYAKKYDLRAGWGLSAIQIGIDKRWFIIVDEQEDGTFKEYFFANPKIISNSTEKIYVEQGEGCLSVNREVVGIIPRYARVTIEAYDMDGNKIIISNIDLSDNFDKVKLHLNRIADKFINNEI